MDSYNNRGRTDQEVTRGLQGLYISIHKRRGKWVTTALAIGSWHRTHKGKDPTLLTDLCNIITRKWGIKEDNWGEYQKRIYIGVKVTDWCSSHLHEKEGWRTTYVYELLITEYYHCEELLPLTSNH